VTKQAALAKIIRKSFTFAAANAAFQNARLRYVDKWLAKRSFSRLFFRVTPRPKRNYSSKSGLCRTPLARIWRKARR
jgi:hypothetical protein